MELVRKLGVVESICALNFLSFTAIWLLDGGLFNSPHGLVFSIDVTTFIPWLVTAVSAIVASVYGLLRLRDILDRDDRTKRLIVCSICLFANAVLIAAMVVPNGAFTFEFTNLYSLGL